MPDLGSHRFKLRTGCRIEEIASLVDGVLYYTLPSIAALVFPEPEQWKKSWETVYRSLMPHLRSIIEDEQQIKSISELPFSQLPHGVPGPWTEQVVREISNHFQISPKSLPQQLIVQLGICEEGWPYIRRTTRTYHHFSPDKKNAQKNVFGILFSFVPRRLLPEKQLTQSQSTFFWAHNTNMQAAISILRDEELIRPSKWQEQPPPNRKCTNWNEVWVASDGILLASAAFNLMKRRSRQQRSSREYTLIAPCALADLQDSGKIIAIFHVAKCTPTPRLPTTLIAFTPKMAGGNSAHQLRFRATWGCSGE